MFFLTVPTQMITNTTTMKFESGSEAQRIKHAICPWLGLVLISIYDDLVHTRATLVSCDLHAIVCSLCANGDLSIFVIFAFSLRIFLLFV